MNCAQFESTLADHLDGTLSSTESAAIEQHVASCPACAEFMAEVTRGVSFLNRATEVAPPAELITRIAYQAPLGKTREPFERQSWFNRLTGRWLLPILRPKLAMGMAMTILSFAMLERCTGIQTQRIQAADLNPVRVWGGVDVKALRVKDRVLKYYDNLRVVYEIETRLRDLQEQQDSSSQQTIQTRTPGSSNLQSNGSGVGRQSQPAPKQGNRP